MRTIPMEKTPTKYYELVKKEFKKDFGPNGKMCLCPISTPHELQMVTNWMLESDLDHYNHQQKMAGPLSNTRNLGKLNEFMVKMEPSIPVAKVQILKTQDDYISLQQSCIEHHLIIRAVFNPKFKHHPSLYMNAIRICNFYCFTQIHATQVWFDIPSYQTSLIQIVKDLGFQQQSVFFGQAYPSIKLKMTLREFKRIEFFHI